jgi:hypothetical protein
VGGGASLLSEYRLRDSRLSTIKSVRFTVRYTMPVHFSMYASEEDTLRSFA